MPGADRSCWVGLVGLAKITPKYVPATRRGRNWEPLTNIAINTLDNKFDILPHQDSLRLISIASSTDQTIAARNHYTHAHYEVEYSTGHQVGTTVRNSADNGQALLLLAPHAAPRTSIELLIRSIPGLAHARLLCDSSCERF